MGVISRTTVIGGLHINKSDVLSDFRTSSQGVFFLCKGICFKDHGVSIVVHHGVPKLECLTMMVLGSSL